MATNDFLPFAGGAGANVLTQADYEALAALPTGFTSGILLSDHLNKVLRQGTVMAAALAQWIADKSGNNVVDDGTTATIEASLTAALVALGLRAASTTQTGVSQLATDALTLALADTGKVVTPSNLGALLASTTQKGLVELADSTEAQALTDASKPITPATLKAASQGANQSLASSGYQKFPGGLILQWGVASSDATGTAVFTFPVAFPTAAARAFGVHGNTSRTPYIVNMGGNSTTSATAYVSDTTGAARASAGVIFFVVGY